MKWDGYKEVNVVRRYKEHVNVSITHKIPKLRHPHTKRPLSQVCKGNWAIREKIGQNARVRLNGLATVKKNKK